MTFGEKLLNLRLALNMSQQELAEKAGITERSIYSYEQTGTFPRASVLRKLAKALHVSETYLKDDNETDRMKNIDVDFFFANVKNKFGHKGAREAQAVLEKASALFAGGELDEEAKEIFFQSLMEVYMESKAEAQEKFAPKRRRTHRV